MLFLANPFIHFVDTPPPEPPVLVIPLSATGIEDVPISIQIEAIIPGQGDTDGLEIYVDNIPIGSNFNRGRQEGGRWIFTPEDFGEVELKLPPGFSGNLSVDITAVAAGAIRQRSLIIDVQPVVSTTTVIVTREIPATTTDDSKSSAVQDREGGP